MGLFSNLFGASTQEKAAQWLDALEAILPQVLSKGDAYDRTEDGAGIIIKHGSAHLMVEIVFDDQGDGYVSLESPLVYMPTSSLLPFYRRLLDMNDENVTFGALATRGNVVLLIATIPMVGLDEEGFGVWVFSVMEEADQLDDVLINEFGVRRFDPNDE